MAEVTVAMVTSEKDLPLEYATMPDNIRVEVPKNPSIVFFKSDYPGG